LAAKKSMADSGQSGMSSREAKSASGRNRAARATLIQEIKLRIADVLTTISGRIEILSANAASPYREELLALRQVVMTGAELNQRVFRAAQECWEELGS
jgi:hypothetical protein